MFPSLLPSATIPAGIRKSSVNRPRRANDWSLSHECSSGGRSGTCPDRVGAPDWNRDRHRSDRRKAFMMLALVDLDRWAAGGAGYFREAIGDSARNVI